MKILAVILFSAFSACAQFTLSSAPYASLLSGNTPHEFFRENFEGPGFQNTWFTNTLSPDAGLNSASTAAPAPLIDSYSMRVALSGDNRSCTNFSIDGRTYPIYGFFAVKFSNLPNSSEFFGVYSNATMLYTMGATAGNALAAGNDGSCCSFAGTPLTTTITNYVWFTISSAGQFSALYSSTTAQAGQIASVLITGGKLSGNAIRFGSTNATTYTMAVDRVILSNAPIGDNP